jgi:hypothetical protein
MRRLLVLSMVLVAASCSSGDAATTAIPTTAVRATTTSTTAPPTTTTMPATTTTTMGTELPEVPLPDVKIEDARDAFRLITTFIDDLSRNPQLELLELYYDPACSAYQAQVDYWTDFVENDWHFAVFESTEIIQLLPVFQREADAQMVATYRIAPDEVLDSAGTLVRTEPEQVYERGIYLTWSDEFGWRICEARDVVGG